MAGILSLDEQKTMFHALDDWFFSEQGQHVAHAFLREMTPFHDLLHGETLIQLGRCGNTSFFSKCRFQHAWVASPSVETGITLTTSFSQLPIERDSVDCLIAPMILDAFSHENNPIDELDRVLKSMGYIVFFGIAPFSLWGYWVRRQGNLCFMNPGKPKSVFSIKRTLLSRGYIQCHLASFYYIPPLQNKAWIEKFELCNEIGKMISIIPANFYCLVVQKHQENWGSPLLINEKKSLKEVEVAPMQPTFLQ